MVRSASRGGITINAKAVSRSGTLPACETSGPRKDQMASTSSREPVSPRKGAAAALGAKAAVEALWESSSQGILAISHDGKIVRANQSSC